MDPLQHCAEPLDPYLHLLELRCISLRTCVREAWVASKRNARLLRAREHVFEPLRIDAAKEPDDLRLERLVTAPLGEDEERLELVLGALVRPLGQQLARHECCGGHRASTLRQGRRCLPLSDDARNILEDHHAEDPSVADVIACRRFAISEQIERDAVPCDEGRGSRFVRESLLGEHFDDGGTVLQYDGLRDGDVDVLGQRWDARVEPEEAGGPDQHSVVADGALPQRREDPQGRGAIGHAPSVAGHDRPFGSRMKQSARSASP